jgi:hypothetical protein
MIDMKRVEVQQKVDSGGTVSPNFVGPGGSSPDAGIITGQVTNWLNTNKDAKPLGGKELVRVEKELTQNTQKYDVTPQFELGVGRTLYVHTDPKTQKKTAFLEETVLSPDAPQRWIEMKGFQMPAAFPRDALNAAPNELPQAQPGDQIKSSSLPAFFPRPAALRSIDANVIKNAVTNGTAKEVSKPAGEPQKFADGRTYFSIPVFDVQGKGGSKIEVPYNLTGFVVNGELYAINKNTDPRTYLDCGKAPLFMA